MTRALAGAARARPRGSASTSTPAPTRSTSGARMNTAWNGVVEPGARRGRPRSCRPGGRSRCGARRCRWRRSCAGRAGRRAPRWPAGSSRRRCRTPACRRARRSASGSNRPDDVEQHRHRRGLAAGHHQRVDAVELGGCADLRRRRRRARAARRACAANAPCSASTPTVTRPSPGGSEPVAGHGACYQPRSASAGSSSSIPMPVIGAPRPRLTLARMCGVAEVGGGLDDGLGPRRRVVALEDARADEHGLGAELHGQRGVGRGGDAAGAEQRHGQLSRSRRPPARAAAAPAAAWPSRTARPSRPG